MSSAAARALNSAVVGVTLPVQTGGVAFREGQVTVAGRLTVNDMLFVLANLCGDVSIGET